VSDDTGHKPTAAYKCTIGRDVDIYLAIGRGREMANALGFDAIDRTRIEIVILELTRNLLVHAGGGVLLLEQLASQGRVGLVIESRDNGPGIADIALAMRDGYSTASTLGAGLPGVKRLMDEFRIDSTVGIGTHIWTVKWVPQRREGWR
jgi:anti-sigma regulatory factor (Ser/Thr protein kinase)